MSKTYLFEVIDGDRSILSGEVEAETPEEARWLLKEEYPQLQRIVSLIPAPIKAFLPVRVPLGQLVSFYRRLAVLLAAGVNIDKAFIFLLESSDGPLAEVVDILRKDTTAGRSLTSSMNRPELKHVFSPLAQGLISTGLQTGALAESLGKLADITETRQSQRQAFVSALTYPAILGICICGVALIFLIFVAPGDTGLFKMIGDELPWPSMILVKLSNFLRNPLLWLIVVFGLVISIPTFRRLWQSEGEFRAFCDKQILRLPLFGTLIEKLSASQVLYVWSSGVKVGLPLTTAIDLSQQVLHNTDIRSRLNAATRDFHNGLELGQALDERGVFPPLVTSMISISLETGEFDTMMDRVSTLYEEEVDVALDQLSSVLEPLLLLVAGVMAGFVALACLMPMLRLTTVL